MKSSKNGASDQGAQADDVRAKALVRWLTTAPDATAPVDALVAWLRDGCGLGLWLLLVAPGGKAPVDMRPGRQKTHEDMAAKDAARAASDPHWMKRKSQAGVHLATDDGDLLAGYVARYREIFGEGCAVNVGVAVGPSRLAVVDCDTAEEVTAARALFGLPRTTKPTVRSPGQLDAETGEWVHKDGGHFWFVVPNDIDAPTGRSKLPSGAGALKAGSTYVLTPPSVRPEGAYAYSGPVRAWTPDIAAKVPAAPAQSAESRTGTADAGIAASVNGWAAATPWSELLERHGWAATGRPDGCGCETWTAPGVHATPKSATAHEAECALWESDSAPDNRPLHIWTDNPGDELEGHIQRTGKNTITKLQFLAAMKYEGDVGAAMSALGIEPEAGDGLGFGDPESSTTKDDPVSLYFDVGAYFDGGELPPPAPEVGVRTDGVGLFYRGCHNTVYGDPEGGKTLLLDVVTVEELNRGGRVLRIDIDHNGPRSTLARIVEFGGDRAAMRDPARFLYTEVHSPEAIKAVLEHMQEWSPTLVIIDSIGELMPMFGHNPNDANDYTQLNSEVLIPFIVTEHTCLITVDHLAKYIESRRYGAGGSAAKKRAADGSYLLVEADERFAPGRGGSAWIKIGKDRHGGLREQCEPVLPGAKGDKLQVAAKFVLGVRDEDGQARGVLDPRADPLDTAAKAAERQRRTEDAAVHEALLREVCAAITENCPLAVTLASGAGKQAANRVIDTVKVHGITATHADVVKHADRMKQAGLLDIGEFDSLPSDRRGDGQRKGRYWRPARSYPRFASAGVGVGVSEELWDEIAAPALAHLDGSNTPARSED